MLRNANRLAAGLGIGLKLALQWLLILLVLLAAVDTVAFLLLNVIYEPAALRPRQIWRPTLTRNLILAAPCLILLFVLRGRAEGGTSSSVRDRFAAIFTRVLRIMCWLALVLVGIVEAAVLAGNLLVHQTLALTRTPSQTLNLLYVTLVAISACTYLVLTRSARPAEGDVPNELRALAGLVWHSLKRGAQFSAMFGVVFVAGALVFYKTIIEGGTFQVFFLAGDFIVLGAVYVIGGAVCGAAVGGIRAAHERVDEIVRSFHSLAEPLIRALVQSAGAEQGKSSQSQLAAASERARGLLARLVQWRFIRVMRGHWVLELLHDYAAHPAAHPSQSLEQVLGERLIRGTADDIRARLRLTQWVTLAIAALIWWAPALLILLRQSPSSR